MARNGSSGQIRTAHHEPALITSALARGIEALPFIDPPPEEGGVIGEQVRAPQSPPDLSARRRTGIEPAGELSPAYRS